MATIGVDLGGTKLLVALIDQSGEMLTSKIVPTNPTRGPQAVMDDIVDLSLSLAKEAHTPLSSIGIGIAGQVDNVAGIVKFAPNLNWHNVDMRTAIEKKTGASVAMTNDVRAATWGEWLHGAGKECDDLVCLFLGTGIGSGVVSGGNMLNGNTGSFGEVGHFPIKIDGPLCTCGNRGCFEALAGGWAIARQAREEVTKNPAAGKTLNQLTKGHPEQLSAKYVIQAALEGDPLSKKILDEVLVALIAGCSGIVNTLNPRRLVIGGGLAGGFMQTYPTFISVIDKGVRACALKSATEKLEIVPSHLGTNAGVIGAAAFAKNSFEKETV